jgi:hypothetical protein
VFRLKPKQSSGCIVYVEKRCLTILIFKYKNILKSIYFYVLILKLLNFYLLCMKPDNGFNVELKNVAEYPIQCTMYITVFDCWLLLYFCYNTAGWIPLKSNCWSIISLWNLSYCYAVFQHGFLMNPFSCVIMPASALRNAKILQPIVLCCMVTLP